MVRPKGLVSPKTKISSKLLRDNTKLNTKEATMGASYSQDKYDYEKLKNRLKRYTVQLMQPKTVEFLMFINEDTSFGKRPLSPLTTSTTPSTDLILAISSKIEGKSGWVEKHMIDC